MSLPTLKYAGAMKYVAAIVFVLAGFQTAVWAHAHLDHAEPRVGAEISVSPTQVTIWFSEELLPAESTVKVLDAGGKQIDKKDAHLDATDKKIFIVSLPTLAGGTYKVVWDVVAIDTHQSNGDFKFTVKPQSASSHPTTTTQHQPPTTNRAY